MWNNEFVLFLCIGKRKCVDYTDGLEGYWPTGAMETGSGNSIWS